MEKTRWIDLVGYALLLLGLSIFAVGVGCAVWFWFGELVPWFWRHEGNPWPMLLPFALVACVIGGAIIGNEESAH